MNENTADDMKEKVMSIDQKLNGILDDDDIELAFCLFTIKGKPNAILLEQGHFYDITRELTRIMKERYERMRLEVGF